MEKYTWKQIEEALSIVGIDSNKVYHALLSEAVDYNGRAEQGVDPEGQETYDPRAPAEKAWADQHTVQVFQPAASEYDDGVERINRATEPSAPSSAPRSKTTVSFDRIRRMMT